MPQRKRATVLLSGGIDSCSCVHLLQSEGFEVKGIFVDFGQAAAERERQAVASIADHLGIASETVIASSSTHFGTGELVGRNAFLVFSALLLGRCEEGPLILGIHSGTSYFDCSPAFVARVDPLVRECTDGKVTVAAPFVMWPKDEVYRYFNSTGIPLALTYSCEAGTVPPCGNCASCKDRAKIAC